MSKTAGQILYRSIHRAHRQWSSSRFISRELWRPAHGRTGAPIAHRLFYVPVWAMWQIWFYFCTATDTSPQIQIQMQMQIFRFMFASAGSTECWYFYCEMVMASLIMFAFCSQASINSFPCSACTERKIFFL